MTSDPGYDENLRDFLAEATEHVESLNQLMLKLEDMVTSGLDLDILNTMFRNAHSLKGMSGMMGFTRLNGLTHKMENILDLLRNGQLAPDANLIEVLFASFDALNDLINEIRAGQGEQRDVTELLARISQVSGAAAPDTSAPGGEAAYHQPRAQAAPVADGRDQPHGCAERRRSSLRDRAAARPRLFRPRDRAARAVRRSRGAGRNRHCPAADCAAGQSGIL